MAESFTDLQEYQADMRHYLRAKAMGDWPSALKHLNSAIVLCPVDEALPTLAALREEAAAQAKPKGFLAKLVLGVKG